MNEEQEKPQSSGCGFSMSFYGSTQSPLRQMLVFFFYIEIVLRIVDFCVLGERHGVLLAAAKSHIHHADIRLPHDVAGDAVRAQFTGGTVILFVAESSVDQAFLFHEQKANQSHPDQAPF